MAGNQKIQHQHIAQIFAEQIHDYRHSLADQHMNIVLPPKTSRLRTIFIGGSVDASVTAKTLPYDNEFLAVMVMVYFSIDLAIKLFRCIHRTNSTSFFAPSSI